MTDLYRWQTGWFAERIRKGTFSGVPVEKTWHAIGGQLHPPSPSTSDQNHGTPLSIVYATVIFQDVPMIFPWFWFPPDFPVIFPWCSYDFPVISSWFSHNVPIFAADPPPVGPFFARESRRRNPWSPYTLDSARKENSVESWWGEKKNGWKIYHPKKRNPWETLGKHRKMLGES